MVKAGHGISCSLSRTGDVGDTDAVARSFWTLGTEQMAGKVYRSGVAARDHVDGCIARLHYHRRWHPTPGYLSLIAFEER